MNTAQRQWIEALESGRYTQGRGQLQTPDGRFCCLGVLTREFDTAFDQWDKPYAPTHVAALVGLSKSDQECLAVLNDAQEGPSWSFAEIAELLRQIFEMAP